MNLVFLGRLNLFFCATYYDAQNDKLWLNKGAVMGRNNNQSALLRQWELLKLIPSHGNGITSAEMTLALNDRGFQIDKRQVERDLVQVAEAFPIDKNDDQKPFLWKWAPGASVNLPGLAVTDALSLHLVEETLKQLLPLSMLQGLEARFKQAEKQLAILGKENRKARWASKVRVVSPTQPLIPPSIDLKVLEVVQDMLLADLQVDVEYVNRAGVKKQHRLNPLAMVSRGPMTYLIASAPEYEDVRLFAMHRIRHAVRTTLSVVPHADFDLDEYIQAGGLQFGNGKTIRLVAWVGDDLAQVLTETPLSKDQTLVPEGDMIKLTATVADSWQLAWWIMSYGDGIEVTSPVALRKSIAARLSDAAAQYEGE